MNDALDLAALTVSAVALVSGVVVLISTRRLSAALPVLLDLLTAAGLLRLAADPSWQRIASAAAIVALRHLLVHGLRVEATTRPTSTKAHQPASATTNHPATTAVPTRSSTATGEAPRSGARPRSRP